MQTRKDYVLLTLTKQTVSMTVDVYEKNTFKFSHKNFAELFMNRSDGYDFFYAEYFLIIFFRVCG